MSSRTQFLSRLLGLYLVLAGLAMGSHKQVTVETMNGLIRNPSAMFIAGVMALIAGLAIVLSHNIWTGGALPVIVTLLGWITLVKGLLCFFLTPEGAVWLFRLCHYDQLFYLYVGICIVMGAYLTYGGFRTASR